MEIQLTFSAGKASYNQVKLAGLTNGSLSEVEFLHDFVRMFSTAVGSVT